MWPHQDTKMSWPSSNSVFLSAEHWLQGGNHSYWSGMLCLLQIPSIVISKHMHSTTSSTNDGLCRLINTLKQQVSADNIADINTLDQAVSYAALHLAIYSRGGTFEAECSFTSRCVWLLSWKITTNHATTWYCMHVMVPMSEVSKLQIGFEANFHPCWNATWLTNVVSRSMVYIVLYRHGGDLDHALNVCLGQARGRIHSSDHRNEVPMVENSDLQQTMSECCLALNSILVLTVW